MSAWHVWHKAYAVVKVGQILQNAYTGGRVYYVLEISSALSDSHVGSGNTSIVPTRTPPILKAHAATCIDGMD